MLCGILAKGNAFVYMCSSVFLNGDIHCPNLIFSVRASFAIITLNNQSTAVLVRMD